MANSRRRFLLNSAAAAGVLHAQSTQPKPPEIFEAAAAGDVPRATNLVKADPQVVRSRLADGRTPLHFATAAGRPAMVTFLVSQGAEINAGKETALIAAVDCADHEAASEMSWFLLANAADPNVRRGDGTSVLQLAIGRGYEDVIEMLIHRGAQSGHRVPDIKKVHFDRRYLEDLHGNPVKRDDSNGLPWTAINEFVRLAHFDLEKVQQLLKATPALLSTRASWDELAIEAAAHTGQVAMAEWLAERGSPVSTCTATLLGLTGHVRRAVEQDPQSIYERGAHDIAILGYTVYGNEQADIAELLLKAHADPHAKALALTPLHVAAMKGYLDVAALLLDHGADINASVKTRGHMVTPVAAAVEAKQDKMERFLKSHGGRA